MRRIVLGLAGAAVALVVALVALAVRTPPGEIETQLLTALRAGSGLRVDARGPVSFTLVPPRVRLEGVTVSDGAGAPLLTVRALIATPRLRSLLAGRVELDEITLKTPTLAADTLDLDAVAGLLRTQADERARLPSLRIIEGVVTWPGGRVDAIEAGVAWPRVDRKLSLTGSGNFRGQPIEAAATVGDPIAVARGDRSGVKIKLTGGGARLMFDGEAVADGGQRKLAGDIGFRAKSLKDVAVWFGAAAPALGARLADVTLSGRATVDRNGVAVENTELAVDGANFVGVARFALNGGRPDIQATLDARAIDVTHYLDGFSPTLGDDDRWSTAALDVRPFRALDLDLRLSAQSVQAGPLRFGPTAATISIANGALDVGVGEASAYGGSLGGRVTVTPDGRTARVRVQAQTLDLDVAAALRDAVGTAALSGALTGDTALDGSGATIAEIVAGLSGRGSARIEGGTIGGFRSRALALLGLGSRLEIRSAEGVMTMARGVARMDDLVLGGPSAQLRLSGEADIVRRRLALGGSLSALDSEGPAAPVRVEGPFGDPKLKLGSRQPERRSERTPDATPAKAER